MDIWTVEGRVKSFKQLGWPHLKNSKVYKLVDAEKMAMAGFYCRPLTGSEDNVCCFICSKNLDGWEPMDEAWREHCSHASSCPLVTLESRERTYEGRWPHERPSANIMSQGGFFYYPRTREDDTAYCYQCGLGLDGWEAEDDPWHEHARRRSNCPFIQKQKLMEPAAFQRILGSSSESYIKELPFIMAVEQKENNTKEEVNKGRIVEELREKKEYKENVTTKNNFQNPKKREIIVDVENENEKAIFDSLMSSGLIKKEELEMSLEDFVLKSLVQRELDFFDANGK